MIRRIYDAETINGFANDPDIVMGLGAVVDFSHAMRETAVFLFGEHGGYIFEWSSPDVYEVHAMIAKDGRGQWALKAARQALLYIASMGSRGVWARIDPARPGIAWMARRCGFSFVESKVLYAGDTPQEYLIFERSFA